jgi:TM2 domain-containing membrane protein YozV
MSEPISGDAPLPHPDQPAEPVAPSFAPPTAAPAQFTTTPVPAAFCRACGEGIDPRAVICPKCGVATGHGQAALSPVLVSGAKSGGVAIALSILFTGAGHWYTGEVGRGFAFLGAAFLAALSLFFVIGIIALPAIWIWAAIDANKSAERHNARLAAVQRQPALA